MFYKKAIGLFIVILLSGISASSAQDCSASLDTWSSAGLQDYSGNIYDIAVHPDKARVIFAATSRHLLMTDNCGSSWDTLQTANQAYTRVMFHPTDADTILALDNRIIASMDGGTSWSRIDSGIAYGSSGKVSDIGLTRKHPDRIYAALTGTGSTNFYTTTDFGSTWTASEDSTQLLETRELGEVAVFGGYEPDRVFVTTRDSNQILVSKNGANSWINTSLNPERRKIDYFDNSGSFGLWLALHSEGLMRLHYDHNDSLDVYTTTFSDSISGIKKMIYTPVGVGEGRFFIHSGGVVFLGAMIPTSGQDEDKEWDDQNAGLPHRNLTDLESGSFEYIFVSLQDTLSSNGVYIRQKPVFTDIEEEQNNRPEQFSLSKNYPNPFNPVTHIRYNLPVSSHVQLTVYNSVGQEVTKLIDQRMSAGKHQVTFDASGLPSGVYIYRLEADGFSQSRKLLLLK